MLLVSKEKTLNVHISKSRLAPRWLLARTVQNCPSYKALTKFVNFQRPNATNMRNLSILRNYNWIYQSKKVHPHSEFVILNFSSVPPYGASNLKLAVFRWSPLWSMDFTASLARTKMIKRSLFQKLKLKSLTSPEKKKAELQKNYRRPKKSIRGKNIFLNKRYLRSRHPDSEIFC